MSARHSLGVIHGRFQILHKDHLEYLLAGKSRCEHLVVGITNPDPSLTQEDPADPVRTDPRANPLTYFERYTLVRRVLAEAGLSEETFSVVPFPVNRPRLYGHYVPLRACFFLTIYDDWGRKKLDTFRSLNLQTEVLWERTPETKGISASTVRERMLGQRLWGHLVPNACARLMQAWSVPRRLRGLTCGPGQGDCD
ncbi:MAG: nicotinate-nucleotide adenylyltransferase [Desulfohalobiaceae bacterium]|nr:nicotinate-nucleotide adenylyltransferase [Desulfohalobiaceae bacterium]MCF8085955.1 nicotinate-nucleotide adenylyltransferase [Desulfohalobiaceae bacterium]